MVFGIEKLFPNAPLNLNFEVKVKDKKPEESPEEDPTPANIIEADPVYKNEFHQLSSEFISCDVEHFRDKYPLITLVAAISFAFFGLMNVLSFSPTNILTGAFLLVLSFALAKSIYNSGFDYLGKLKNGIGQILSTTSTTVVKTVVTTEKKV